MYTVYAADQDNERLNYVGEYRTLRGARNAYGKERNERNGFCHGRITNQETGEEYRF